MVQDSNRDTADIWNYSGAAYDFISFAISDILAKSVQTLWPKPGERILEVATGTGWCARNIALFGANVTAIDIADNLLDSARSRSAHITPAIQYQHADAECLPFEDGYFDGVISTFGIMFAGNHVAAANELGRVCRTGGSVVLTTWAPGPDSLIARMFELVGRHAGMPPPLNSPLDWGRSDCLHQLLSEHFDIAIDEEVSTSIAPSGDEIWRIFYEGFGPVRKLADRLNGDSLSNFREEFISLHEEYRIGERLQLKRNCLLITGTRK